MTRRERRREIFGGPPRVLLRRTGERFIDACALASVLNGVIVSGFGVVTLVLYVDVGGEEVLAFAGCSALWYAIEGLVAGLYLRHAGAPVRSWLAGDRRPETAQRAWSAAARLPLHLVRRPSLYVIGAVGAGGTALVLAGLLDLPARDAVLLLPASYLLYVYSAELRYIGFELMMRPVLEAVGADLPRTDPPDSARVSLHQRLVATVPMVTWGSGIIVGGLLTDDTRDFDTIALASVVAIAVAAAISVWLSLVLADAVSRPIVELRDATRRVGDGDLSVRVPVVSTDETGELAASFNAMVAGLAERDQLHKAFSEYVDPTLTDRVLAEGTDLAGEEVEVSVLFLDVRDFTAFAEGVGAQEVVGALNDLYEAVVPLIVRHGGHANKFIGDGVLAVFGAPQRHADHAARAVAAAREISELVRRDGAGPLRIGVGVNTGRVVVGTIGGGGRRDFTVIGDAVNTAYRVEAATRLTGDDILVTEATLRALGTDAAEFQERPAAPLKGKTETIRLYTPVTPRAKPPR